MKMMNNRDRYKQAFSVLQMSGHVNFEPEKTRIPRYAAIRKTAAACLVSLVVLSMGVITYAYGEQIIREVLGWGGNMKMTEAVNAENGETEKTVTIMTESLTEPVEIENGKMYLVVNDEHIDITGSVSESEPYVYEYTDEDGYIHYWIIGLSGPELEHYGYGEYIKDADDAWISGYTARIDLDPEKELPEWLIQGKDIIGGDCPW